MLQGFKY